MLLILISVVLIAMMVLEEEDEHGGNDVPQPEIMSIEVLNENPEIDENITIRAWIRNCWKVEIPVSPGSQEKDLFTGSIDIHRITLGSSGGGNKHLRWTGEDNYTITIPGLDGPGVIYFKIYASSEPYLTDPGDITSLETKDTSSQWFRIVPNGTELNEGTILLRNIEERWNEPEEGDLTLEYDIEFREDGPEDIEYISFRREGAGGGGGSTSRYDGNSYSFTFEDRSKDELLGMEYWVVAVTESREVHTSWMYGIDT